MTAVYMFLAQGYRSGFHESDNPYARGELVLLSRAHVFLQACDAHVSMRRSS